MPLTDPIVYVNGKERRTLDLRPDGVECIPLLGLSNFQSVRTGTEEHVHPGCVEVSLCVRGNLMFESFGMCYPFLPGTVFVSQPTEPHRMRHNPKGLMLYRILFRIPGIGADVLGLPMDESRWLVKQMTHFPLRLFPATVRVKAAFERLFEVYDTAGRRPAPVLSSKSAALTGGMESRRMSSACSSVTINDLETRAYSRAASGAVDVDARKPSGMFMIVR